MSPDSVLHILNADILDMLASTLMDDFASTSFAIVIHGITPLFFLMALPEVQSFLSEIISVTVLLIGDVV